MIKEHCKDCSLRSSAASHLSDNELNVLENECAQVHFKKGEIIFKQDALASNIIYLKTGLAKLHMASRKRDQIIKIIKAPDFLRISTTIADKVNHYSATAIEDSIACFIDINSFNDFIFKNGEFAYEIIISLSKSELESFRRCVNRNQKQTIGRVADALIYFSEQIYYNDEFDFPLSRNDLADLICSSRESVSRVLGEFDKDKIIKLDGKKIKIRNKALLQQIGNNG